MKTLLTLYAVGTALLLVQGGLTAVLPQPWCPDFALLYVLGLGLHAPSAAGALVVAAALGYTADLLSASLFGQHALLALIGVSAAWIACRQLNLRGPLPWFTFCLCAVGIHGLATRAITDLATGPAPMASPAGLGWLATAIVHAVWTAVFASLIATLAERAAVWGGDDESTRRSLQLFGGRG